MRTMSRQIENIHKEVDIIYFLKELNKNSVVEKYCNENLKFMRGALK